MKTNEAPEKIYLHPDIGGREFIKPWLKRKVSQESIEYTRTDAFIEKACDYFQTINFKKYFDGLGDILVFFQQDEFVEDFRQAMKGE